MEKTQKCAKKLALYAMYEKIPQKEQVKTWFEMSVDMIITDFTKEIKNVLSTVG